MKSVLLLLAVTATGACSAFQPSSNAGHQYQRHTTPTTTRTTALRSQNSHEDNESEETTTSRRKWLLQSAASATATAAALLIDPVLPARAATATTASSNSVFKAAKRPTAYRVDSTVPPTLLALNGAQEQTQTLKSLAGGSGTDKDAIIVDTVNLNNILNKAVFGTASAIQSQFIDKDTSKTGMGYASYVCLGVPRLTQGVDVELAASLLSNMVTASTKNKNPNVAVGLHWAPLSTQSALDQYSSTGGSNGIEALTAAMVQAGVPASTVELYAPLLQQTATATAATATTKLLALSPEYDDLALALKSGLQPLSAERRANYVIDQQGFIGMTELPQFKLYVDRSLLKDFDDAVDEGKPGKGNSGNFFAQRILLHETAATVCAQYAAAHQATSDGQPTPLVALVAPIPDLRYLVGGINGRLSRVSNYLGMQKVSPNAVTTILLNPTAQETLSRSRYLRLEIGTGPATLDYQAKVADYLWFSASPKVNLIPRLMN